MLRNLASGCMVTFLLAVTMVPLEQKAMAYGLSTAPPLSQENTEVRVGDASFDERCRSYFRGMAAKLEWRIMTVVVTRSAEWGLVWRADFEVEGLKYSTPMLNRLVCWENSNGNGLSASIAIGQMIDPLELH